MEQAIAAWLNAEVLWGDSEFADKDEVKRLIFQPRNRRWDAVRKVWGSKSMWDARRLIQSNVWWPCGVDRSWRTNLLLELENRIAAAENEMQAKAAVVSEKKRAASMPTTEGPSWEERERLIKDRERGIRECTEEEKRACSKLGLSENVVAESLKRETVGAYNLGPRAGLSASERELRLVRIEKNAARVRGEDEDESVRKLVATLTSTDWDAAEAKAVKKQKLEKKTKKPVAESKEKVEVKKEVRKVVRQTGPVRLAKGECQHCRRPVSVQFLCCGCFNRPWSEKWIVCRVCEKIVNPLLRGCEHVKKES